MKPVLALLLLSATSANALDVPSGQPITLQEVLVDSVGAQSWLRFRFVAPQIARDGGTVDYEAAAEDMAHICDSFAIAYAQEYDLTADIVVVSLADRATEFGLADPDATQFFEAYRIEDGLCIWEGL